jgi:hypothetical protein
MWFKMTNDRNDYEAVVEKHQSGGGNSRIAGVWSGGFVLVSKSIGGRDEIIFQINSKYPARQIDLNLNIAGLSTWLTELNLQNGRAQCFVISPSLESYGNMFELLSDYLVGEFTANLHYKGAVSEVQDALIRWSEFLKRRRGNARVEKIQGLLGELLTIRDLIKIDSFEWQQWVGPSGSPQDFKGTINWVEVKTTNKRNGALVHKIASVDQLQSPPEGELFVVSYRLLVSKTGTKSVSDLVNEVGSLEVFSNPSARDYFSQSVQDLGFDKDLPAELSRYDVFDVKLFKVGAGFPRLLRSDLPSDTRITDISYSLDFSAIEEFQVDHLDSRLDLN